MRYIDDPRHGVVSRFGRAQDSGLQDLSGLLDICARGQVGNNAGWAYAARLEIASRAVARREAEAINADMANLLDAARERGVAPSQRFRGFRDPGDH